MTTIYFDSGEAIEIWKQMLNFHEYKAKFGEKNEKWLIHRLWASNGLLQILLIAPKAN